MTYLIAGASSDIGCELIKYINENEQGTTVFAHYNNGLAKLQNIKEECKNITLIPVQADLSEEGGADTLLKVVRKFGAEQVSDTEKNVNIKDIKMEDINHLIYLPAYPFNYMRLKELNIETLKKEMQISAYSFLELCKALVPGMKKLSKIEGNPVSTVFAMLTKYVTDDLPPKFMTDYIVSKYALLGAVKSIESEHGGATLNVSYLASDMIETAFLKNIDPKIIEINREVNGGLLTPGGVAKEIYEKINF